MRKKYSEIQRITIPQEGSPHGPQNVLGRTIELKLLVVYCNSLSNILIEKCTNCCSLNTFLRSSIPIIV